METIRTGGDRLGETEVAGGRGCSIDRALQILCFGSGLVLRHRFALQSLALQRRHQFCPARVQRSQ
jgi:hypothetical protein